MVDLKFANAHIEDFENKCFVITAKIIDQDVNIFACSEKNYKEFCKSVEALMTTHYEISKYVRLDQFPEYNNRYETITNFYHAVRKARNYLKQLDPVLVQ